MLDVAASQVDCEKVRARIRLIARSILDYVQWLNNAVLQYFAFSDDPACNMSLIMK
jgi:hypothetical protein